ncbi:MAG: undecaprenyldiphospho-muramoylpentapeptide beta-N-acetylglucosaminyltransferase [Alphaproteobacteria bacterium]|nr:undecaprenyldiphospho-muramoylpentapeptide beta-N-acetylglucosaminyltransferase [Alphaproteobacteria bacterium]MDA7982723.1 undecaprenyldiphospho-muramoylpentapeptide beta-N-acetylglucosaminyltransferase [Alphaproteobacteria bacterium]MDA8008583.1 undecaprenyldiphospho-muramoylpentapeptide beta-N-acetylglucosaminyltransferase [Alphaproteobacteria bacterium]
MTKNSHIVLVAGGTAGHLFPALATAQTLQAQDYSVALICDHRTRSHLQSQNITITAHTLPAASPRSRNPVTIALATFTLINSTLKAARLFIARRPRAVITFGGYTSIPPAIAAITLRIPTIIHEQNHTLGLANKLLAPVATTIATSFPDTRGLPKYARRKTTTTGTPVRANIAAVAGTPYKTPQGGGTVNVLVIGGSQGAETFNHLIPETIALLPENIRGRLRITQQVRGDTASVRRQYQDLNINADLAGFFTNIDELLADTHLVIARAGASTVAELVATARPAILIPYPHAANNHQTHNARNFANLGGGQMLAQDKASPRTLADTLAEWLANPDKLIAASNALRNQSPKNPEARLANCVRDIIARKSAGRRQTKERLAL